MAYPSVRNWSKTAPKGAVMSGKPLKIAVGHVAPGAALGTAAGAYGGYKAGSDFVHHVQNRKKR